MSLIHPLAVERRISLSFWLSSLIVLPSILLATSSQVQAQPPVHYLHQGTLPPGEIGRRQLDRGGPLRGYFQPVQVSAPAGAKIELATGEGFVPAGKNGLLAGMLIGNVYRLKVSNIPDEPGIEVYPTIEVVDRLYPPPGQAARFPIPVELTDEELKLAAKGNYVQRVIYLENPQDAVPVKDQLPRQRYYEVAPHQDLMQTADQLGRPMAILRMGSRVPTAEGDEQFLYASPPAQILEVPGANVRRSDGLEQPIEAAATGNRAASRKIPRTPVSAQVR